MQELQADDQPLRNGEQAKDQPYTLPRNAREAGTEMSNSTTAGAASERNRERCIGPSALNTLAIVPETGIT